MIEYADWETGETQRLVERVDILEQQRAELLEALHKICNVSAIDVVKDPSCAQRIANAAITKAEATE